MKASSQLSDIVTLLNRGKIGVLPTDTIYGLVGSALRSGAVEKIYKLRKRAKDKPMIILVSSLNDLNNFNIKLTGEQKKFLEKTWPNPVSVVLPCSSKRFSYLHRGKESMAFRMPNDKMLLEVLRQTGPLVAPSANYEGEVPAENINQAKKYFEKKISFYIAGGKIKSQPSTIISLDNEGNRRILRQGIFKL
ncbi:threonylcarbamoyl-AMP synthase [Candidatus Daviesbacteria bacterium RIFCSPHIGHO2_02_FULL_39_12]|uniref:L-threonylcarbamoyladenylate synthase n=2 Tax=Candidatus Daviesiibacteriota TaxID=1752718 RepID=A0A1F5JA03_9BACT|nr:MAG: threonylcarbamoyl-AMP synthase [Candidatus Daviesbacteria bacterium RIFCSPHIGHO2_02_FULL_39_12]OGE71486.1 MAG: threonylcarbamoyl-AMP synthase [Candidatus Daviesbacteria bacterium RIFCSPLOWO2_02_FULL_38_15]